MASVANLKPVQTTAEDDGVRERHGCSAYMGFCSMREDGTYVILGINNGEAAAPYRETSLSPARARYVGRKLYRLARRIEKRELVS